MTLDLLEPLFLEWDEPDAARVLLARVLAIRARALRPNHRLTAESTGGDWKPRHERGKGLRSRQQSANPTAYRTRTFRTTSGPACANPMSPSCRIRFRG